MTNQFKEFINLLKKYLKKHMLMVLVLFVIIILNVVFNLLKPKILGKFISAAGSDMDLKYLISLSLLFLIVVIVKAALQLLSASVTEEIGWKSTNDLRIDLVRHLMNLDMSFHKRFSSGQLVERIDGDVNSLFAFFTTFMTGIVLNGAMTLGCTIYLAFIDYRFLIILILVYILVAILFFYLAPKINANEEAWSERSSQYYGVVGEQVTSLEDIRTLNAKDYMVRKSEEKLKSFEDTFIKSGIYGYSAWAYTSFVFDINVIASMLLVAYLLSKNSITIATAFEIFFISDFIREPIDELRAELQYIQKVDASIRRIKEILNTKRSISIGNQEMEKDSDISVSDVNFAYEDDIPVLKNLSFKLDSGKVLGILGRTGSGKTTLARLLVKLYEPQEGNIEYGKYNLKELSDKSIRNKIAYVTQDVQIYNASVRDNISLFNKDISDEKIMSIIKTAGLEKWFLKLPEGLDTMLTGDANFMSSGELQLLTLIRVFLKDPEVIILDEATAKLDPITEKYLENALDVLLKNRTTIIIAHRLKTVLRSDKILILDSGQKLEEGNTKELITDEKSKFRQLLDKGLEEVLV